MFRSLAYLIAMVFAANAAHSSSPTEATRLLTRFNLDNGMPPGSAEGRKALTLAIKNYCNEIDRIYPRNTPQEDQWLDNEIAGEAERLMRAASSAEYGRRLARNFTAGCVKMTGNIEREPNRPFNYIALAWEFSRFTSDAAFFARKNKIDPDMYGFGVTTSSTVVTLLAQLISLELAVEQATAERLSGSH